MMYTERCLLSDHKILKLAAHSSDMYEEEPLILPPTISSRFVADEMSQLIQDFESLTTSEKKKVQFVIESIKSKIAHHKDFLAQFNKSSSTSETRSISMILNLVHKNFHPSHEYISKIGNNYKLKASNEYMQSVAQVLTYLLHHIPQLSNCKKENTSVEEKLECESYLHSSITFKNLKPAMQDRFLKNLNAKLGKSDFICGKTISIADFAIFYLINGLMNDQEIGDKKYKIQTNLEKWFVNLNETL